MKSPGLHSANFILSHLSQLLLINKACRAWDIKPFVAWNENPTVTLAMTYTALASAWLTHSLPLGKYTWEVTCGTQRPEFVFLKKHSSAKKAWKTPAHYKDNFDNRIIILQVYCQKILSPMRSTWIRSQCLCFSPFLFQYFHAWPASFMTDTSFFKLDWCIESSYSLI